MTQVYFYLSRHPSPSGVSMWAGICLHGGHFVFDVCVPSVVDFDDTLCCVARK